MNTTYPSNNRRVVVLLSTLLSAVLLSVLAAGSAGASPVGYVVAAPVADCYGYNSYGQATLAVTAPALEPMPSSNPPAVGGDNQGVLYRPYLQRWTASGWTTVGVGPLFGGVASARNYTMWLGSTGGWTAWTITRQSGTRYYRVLAEVWWVADATHAAYYVPGQAKHLAYSSIYGWQQVAYCTY